MFWYIRGLEAYRDVAMLLPYCIVEEAFELFTLAQQQYNSSTRSLVFDQRNGMEPCVCVFVCLLLCRQFVGYVGGSTLDDNSEILGGVSSVMGRLDTDSEEGIGLKELRCRAAGLFVCSAPFVCVAAAVVVLVAFGRSGDSVGGVAVAVAAAAAAAAAAPPGTGAGAPPAWVSSSSSSVVRRRTRPIPSL